MSVPVYPSGKWNEFAALVRRAWPFPGRGARLAYRSGKVVLEAAAAASFAHPWQVSCVWENYTDAAGKPRGEWRAFIRPGFVNGRDGFLEMPEEWPEKPDRGGATRPVALTDDPAPYLVLDDWRNPLEPASVSATLGGDIVFAKGEGYPKFFERLGVRPASPGGKFPDAEIDPERTREIRAMDIVLTKPRLGSALDVTLLNVFADSQTHQLGATFQNAYWLAQEGRTKLAAFSKHRPLGDQTIASPFLGLPMNAGDPQFDQLKIATVYVVSPPEAGADAEPDQTWSAFPKHDVFWNLSHATRFIPPAAPLPPIRLVTGLAFGILDTLAAAMLAPINSAFNEVHAFLNQADMRGKFWTF